MARYDEPGSDSGSDFDYTEDAMFPHNLPTVDWESVKEQVEGMRDDAQARLEQYQADERRRQRVRCDALISRFDRARQTPRFRHDRRVARRHREVCDYFEFRHRFRYLKTMRGVRPNAGGGGASLFAELEGTVGRGAVEKRRVVVKFGEDIMRMEDEIYTLSDLAKLEHVVNVVHLDDEEMRLNINFHLQDEEDSEDEEREGEEEGEGEGEGNHVVHYEEEERVVGQQPSSLLGSILNHPFWSPNPIMLDQDNAPGPRLPSRPTLVLEYMESGNLHEFRKRMKEAGVNPSNRFLWRVMLCLLRACAGLAYFELLPEGHEVVIKGQAPGTLAHGSLDLSQLLIGSLTPGDDDHEIVPMLKMCGFGMPKRRR
ncbi:hypothetical protein PG994_014942 [Apiospora phragmitis]|uniref:Protein kinase domain-containing protein n=1 Tax=Apiospora phragmitis TaxID=2905665 RepID=A0ABR1SV22_9PEZI